MEERHTLTDAYRGGVAKDLREDIDERTFEGMDFSERGVQRLRSLADDATINGPCELTAEDLYRVCGEVEAELEDGRRARRELAGLKLDLSRPDGLPFHYLGDGTVTAARALRSMHAGWDENAPKADTEAFFWASLAFKYVWRFPVKGRPEDDLVKALDCVQRALDAWEGRPHG